ncbi:MAG: fibronectin type III domain-containing protein [Owenweeksia sp.]|nr:fibronectin type III domain-containing protein [Owenweeksia sp.]
MGFESLSSSDAVELIFTADLSSYVGVPNLQMLLSFYFTEHADETSAGDKVWVRGQQGDSWIEILDWNSAGANTWTYFEIRLDSVLAANSQNFSSTTQVRWGQQDNAAITGNDGFSIDDLRLNASTCPAPTNLSLSNVSQTSVDLSWTSGGAADAVVEYGPPGFALGTGQTQVISGGSPYTLSNLTPGTPYEFYIRDSCGVGDLSFYEGPAVDTTLCTSQLSGPYTIGSGTSADYNSFSAVADDLNLCGISGPVTFNVQAGSYSDHLHLIGVPGVSATNTITFSGADNATLTYDNNGPQSAVIIDGTPHVSLNGLQDSEPQFLRGLGRIA